jgi:UDP-glucose 4-epimerase
MVGAFEKVNGIQIPYEITARREGDIAEMYAGVAKAARELGWTRR